VQHRRAVIRAITGAGCDGNVAARRTAGEGLHGIDYIAAVGLACLAIGFEPVIGASADEDEFPACNLFQQGLPGLAVLIVLARGGDKVLVH